MSNFSLGAGYGIWNNVAPGQGFLGLVGFGPGKNTDTSGQITQMNDGHKNAEDFGTSTNGSIKEVIATDASDTVNLKGNWDDKGYTVDPTTGIAGDLYTNTQGDQYLVSGGATVDTSS